MDMNHKKISRRFADLRQKAEKKFRETGEDLSHLTAKDTKYLLEELRIHQIELEMQNEELKKSERELLETRDKFSDLYFNAPVGYATMDKTGLIGEANITLAAMLGVEREKLIKRSFTDYIDRDNQDRFYFFCQSVFDRGKQMIELKLITKNNFTVYVMLEGMAISVSDRKLSRFRAAITDITERKQAEEKLERANQELISRMETIEKANQEIDDLTYLVSEDLRTPVRYIEGFSRALKEDADEKLNERERDLLNRISKASKRLGYVIDSLTRLSQLTRGVLHVSQVDLSHIIENAVEDMRLIKPIWRIETKISPEIYANADGLFIRNALENLLAYARGLQTLKASITIEFYKLNEHDIEIYCLRISGIEFDSDMSGKLFLPYKFNSSLKGREKSFIALSAVKRIIDRHGGKIWVNCENEKSVTFCFTL